MLQTWRTNVELTIGEVWNEFESRHNCHVLYCRVFIIIPITSHDDFIFHWGCGDGGLLGWIRHDRNCQNTLVEILFLLLRRKGCKKSRYGLGGYGLIYLGSLTVG